MSRSKEKQRSANGHAPAAECSSNGMKGNARMYENEFSRSKAEEKAEFKPEGKVFLPRVDIWTELLDPESQTSSFWYYCSGTFAVCLLAASYLDEDAGDDSLYLARQVQQASLSIVGLLLLSHVWAVALYPAVWLWLKLRPSPKSGFRRPYDITWATVGALAGILYYVTCNVIVSYVRMPRFPALAVTFEQTVVFLKMYAFTWWTVLHADAGLDGEATKSHAHQGPRLKNYIFFLSVPTLVYRHHYPRVDKIRWRFVLRLCLETSMTVFLINQMVCGTLLPAARQWRLQYPGDQGESWEGRKGFCIMILRCLPAAAFCSIATGYLLFRCIQNIAAELTRFADRAFQKDYWNCKSVRRSVALWNIPGHDWLYEHVYIPTYNALGSMEPSKRRVYAAFNVFLVSYFFHDLVVSLTVRNWGANFLPFYLIGAIHFFGMDRVDTGVDWLEKMKAPFIFLPLAASMNVMISNLYVRFGVDGIDGWDETVIHATDAVLEWLQGVLTS